MVTQTKQLSQAKTIRDVYTAARNYYARTKEDCIVTFSVHIGKRGEWTDISVHRERTGIHECDTGVTLQQAIAFFDVTPAEVEQLLPVIPDITAGPDTDIEAALKSKITATVTIHPPDDRGVDWHTKSCDLNFDVLVVDITVMKHEADIEEQYQWHGKDTAHDERVLFRADLQKVEREADRVLAFFAITVESA